ncbi:peptidase dimerization domain-containing protein, partial [Rhodococcus erythropolis]|nr:peptidase dimerization domain-containing protein [Rhodococcus erythropolis]
HVAGRAAHAGLEPEKGINAAVELARLVIAVNDLSSPAQATTVTPTVISAGTTTNTVPAEAFVDVDVRATSAAEQERV